jgi:hypothetical protein
VPSSSGFPPQQKRYGKEVKMAQDGFKMDLIKHCPIKHSAPGEGFLCLAGSEEDCTGYKTCIYRGVKKIVRYEKRIDYR